MSQTCKKCGRYRDNWRHSPMHPAVRTTAEGHWFVSRTEGDVETQQIRDRVMSPRALFFDTAVVGGAFGLLVLIMQLVPGSGM